MTAQISYNGKNYPLKVGFYALKHTSNELKAKEGRDIKMTDVLSDDISILEPLLYHSMVMGAKLEGQTLDITREDAEFVLDAVFGDFLAMIPEFFKTMYKKTEEPAANLKTDEEGK